jgi:peptide/nickel transport system substrate-binding protein
LRGLATGVIGLGVAGCATTPSAPAGAPASGNPAPTPPPTAVATVAAPTAQLKLGGVFKSGGLPSSVTRGLEPHVLGGLGRPGSRSPLVCYSQLLTFKWGKDVTPPSRVPAADLAESWTQPDDLTYVFKLRPGVKWHNIAPVNGRELVAEDIVYSYQRVLDLKSFASLFVGVSKLEATDKSTFKITMQKPNPDLLVNLCNINTAIVAREAVEAKGGNLDEGPAIGTGPWIFDAYAQGQSYRVKRNPDYFLKGLPYADAIEGVDVADNNTLENAFRGGSINVLTAGLLPPNVDALAKAVPGANVTWIPVDENYHDVAFNVTVEPFGDIRVRQAINKAIDRKQIIDTVYSGRASYDGGVTLPDPTWQLPDAEFSRLLARDVEGAKRLLKEAGKESFSFEMLIPPSSVVETAVPELIQANLREIGVNVTLKPQETATISQRGTDGDFQSYVFSVSTGGTPNTWLYTKYYTGGVQNRARFSSPALDKLIDQQAVIARDLEERKKVLQDIQRMIINDSVYLILYARQQPLLTYPEIKDFRPPALLAQHCATWTTGWFDR